MHLYFPFQLHSGTVELASDDDWVVGLIEQVLFTSPGERVNRPQFGCGVERLVFQQNSAQLASAVQYLVQSELQRWLTGIAEIKGIEVDNQDNELEITVDYVNLVTGGSGRATLRSRS
jgi:phage baseplate assembly protein W